MNVKELKRKLDKLPDDAVILVNNNSLFINGDYVATAIEYDKDDNTVLIETDHEDLIFEI